MRDDIWEIIKVISLVTSALLAGEAEIKVLKWATEIAMKEGWNWVLWLSYASNAVREVNSNQDSGGWHTRYAVIKIRGNLKRQNWKLE